MYTPTHPSVTPFLQARPIYIRASWSGTQSNKQAQLTPHIGNMFCGH